MPLIPKTYEDFHTQREIPREVLPDHELTEQEIQHISQVVFLAPKERPSEVLWVIGCEHEAYNELADIYQRGFVQRVIASGGIGREFYRTGTTYGQKTFQKFTQYGINPKDILIEEASANTKDEITNTRTLLDKQGIDLSSILYACKAHHSGRVYRTLKQYFPDAILSAHTFSAIVDGIPLTRETWPHHPSSLGRIYGEYLRIKAYGARGDIAKLEIDTQ